MLETKTTMRKLINNINFTDKQIQTTPDWENLSNVFDIYDLPWSEDERMKCYHIMCWKCTDTWVGIIAYFLDDEFVALSTQTGRKSTPTYKFISKDASETVRKYLIELVELHQDQPNVDIICDLDEEIDSTFTVEYNTQILHKTGIYHGNKVKIINTRFPYEIDKSDRHFHFVEVEYLNGHKEEIDGREIKLAFNNLD